MILLSHDNILVVLFNQKSVFKSCHPTYPGGIRQGTQLCRKGSDFGLSDQNVVHSTAFKTFFA
jgi:hypothetical protein